MLKITKISAIVLIFYILFYLQVWGDNHIVLYGSAMIVVLSWGVYCLHIGYVDLAKVPYGIWNNIIMVIYALLTGIIVAYDYSTVISSSITFVAFSIVCIAISYVSSEEGSFDWVLYILVVLAIVCSVYAFFNGAVWENYGKTLSLTNNPHAFAAVMNLGIFSVAFLNKYERNAYSLASAFIIALLFYSIIECGSRKYLIASSCIIGIWIWSFFKKRWETSDLQQRVLLLLTLMLVLIIVLVFYRYVYLNSLAAKRMMSNDDLGDQKRIQFYRQAWEIFKDRPLLGGGYDQFRYYSGAHGYAHSTYAEAIADFGAIGCILYFSPLIGVTIQIINNAIFKSRDYRSMLLLALCIAEIFLGIGQIFFMEFYHFIAWTIIFNYSRLSSLEWASQVQGISKPSKYIRET